MVCMIFWLSRRVIVTQVKEPTTAKGQIVLNQSSHICISYVLHYLCVNWCFCLLLYSIYCLVSILSPVKPRVAERYRMWNNRFSAEYSCRLFRHGVYIGCVLLFEPLTLDF